MLDDTASRGRGRHRRVGTERHVYVVGARADHADLEQDPSVGAVIELVETDRLRALKTSSSGGSTTMVRHHHVLVAIDGFRLFLDAIDQATGIAGVERWIQLLTSSPRRIAAAVTADRLTGLPGALTTAAPAKLLLRLGDPYDYAAVGLPTVDARRFPPGRGIDARSGLEVQILAPRPFGVAWSRPTTDPDPLSVLPDTIALRSLGSDPRSGAAETLAIGLLDRSRTPALIDLPDGHHLLVVGPDGSGRSATLATITAAVSRLDRWHIIVTGPPRSRLRDDPVTAERWVDIDQLAARCNDHDTTTPVLLLVDDAELLDPPDSVQQLLGMDHVSIVASAHPDRLRSLYGHWTDPFGRARFGIALAPRPHDGELWSTTLPQTSTSSWPPGRGYLLEHGRAELFQVATRERWPRASTGADGARTIRLGTTRSATLQTYGLGPLAWASTTTDRSWNRRRRPRARHALLVAAVLAAVRGPSWRSHSPGSSWRVDTPPGVSRARRRCRDRHRLPDESDGSPIDSANRPARPAGGAPLRRRARWLSPRHRLRPSGGAA